MLRCDPRFVPFVGCDKVLGALIVTATVVSALQWLFGNGHAEDAFSLLSNGIAVVESVEGLDEFTVVKGVMMITACRMLAQLGRIDDAMDYLQVCYDMQCVALRCDALKCDVMRCDVMVRDVMRCCVVCCGVVSASVSGGT
jgi:hypothetical protein